MTTISLNNDMTGLIGSHVSDILVKATTYGGTTFDASRWLLSLVNTALLSPFMPGWEFAMLVASFFNNNALIEPVGGATFSFLTQTNHWLFDLVNANFFDLMSGTVEWYDAWWLTAIHMVIMAVLLPFSMSIILPVEIFVGLFVPAVL